MLRAGVDDTEPEVLLLVVVLVFPEPTLVVVRVRDGSVVTPLLPDLVPTVVLEPSDDRTPTVEVERVEVLLPPEVSTLPDDERVLPPVPADERTVLPLLRPPVKLLLRPPETPLLRPP